MTTSCVIYTSANNNGTDQFVNYPHAMAQCYLIISSAIHRRSYMSAHVLLILLNELGKCDKGLPSILALFFATSLINY